MILTTFSYFVDQPWEVYKFEKFPPNFWDDQNNILQLLEGIGKRLHIRKLDDWFTVTREALYDIPESEIISRYGLVHLLEKGYSSHDWSRFYQRYRVVTICFDDAPSPVKDALIETVQSLYPGEKVHVDYIHPTASVQGVNKLKFDIFIPSKSLAIDLLVNFIEISLKYSSIMTILMTFCMESFQDPSK